MEGRQQAIAKLKKAKAICFGALGKEQSVKVGQLLTDVSRWIKTLEEKEKKVSKYRGESDSDSGEGFNVVNL
jgi:hypothetical protein